ncbi:MAG: FAD-binding protein [Spirochaetales bacterium]|nr:FAD-binding protein [Spirochaetales bacterium]
MNNTFDIIVVGAGLGGLTAAFEPVRAGKRVLLLS